jgi:predicted nucleic acid-binding protein
MKVYLDTCSLNRPFDDQTQPRIHLETEAILWVLQQVDLGHFVLCTSEVLEFENQSHPDPSKRVKVEELLKRGHEYAKTTRDIEERAEQLVQGGLQPLDALHVASAESLKADVLLTCDDRFIKAARRLAAQLKVKVLNPIELVLWRPR